MKKYEIKDKVGEKQTIEHVINLQTKNQSLQLVKSCCISIPRRKGLFTKLPNATYTILVECSVPDIWVINKNDSIMKIGYGGEKAKELSIVADSNQVDFQLFLDPNQIIDCMEKETMENKPYNINYNIILKESSSNNIMTQQSGVIIAKLDNVSVNAPIVSFKPNERGSNLVYNVQYDKPFEIGSLEVKHSSNLLRAPSCNIVLNAIAKVCDETGNYKQIDDLISFGEQITQSNPRYNESGIIPQGTDGSDFSHQIIAGRIVDLKNVDVNKNNPIEQNNNIVSIPVFWNMSMLSNPESKQVEYVLYLETKYNSLSVNSTSSSTTFYDHIRIILKKNVTMMDMEVVIKEGRSNEIIRNNTPIRQRVPDMVLGAYTSYSIVIRNTAEIAERGKEDAMIYVKGFSCNLPQKGQYAIEKKGIIKDSLFTECEGNAISNGYNAAIPIKGSVSYTFFYDHSCIVDIKSDTSQKIYEKSIKIPISFDYFVDKDNLYSSIDEVPVGEFLNFKSMIPMKIRKAPTPEWLCLDFGTSAVVATYASHHYDGQGRRINCLLPLRTTKQNLLRSLYRGDNDNLKNILNDTTEVDVNLIASDIVVDMTTNSIGDSDVDKYLNNIERYKDAPLKFSPSSGMLDINSRKIPSLKSLMGNRTMPTELMPNKVSVQGELTINKIFETAYRQLFKLFLPKEVHNTNKLVMTIPNTYAPTHINILKKIALDSLPNLRPDYIRFMSESDAVAFYYLSKRAELLENTNFNEDFDKNVLVYDMGAGTLDITYFTRNECGDKYEIEMLGKMGVSRAGNYMDYVLADVIVDLLEEFIEDKTVTKKISELLYLENYQNRDADAASELKHYVRDVVKPILNKDRNTKLPALRLFHKDIPTVNITIGNILNHEKFTKFLKEVSNDIFKHFKGLFSTEEVEIAPNLVIYSGRTTCLKVLRNAVRSALTEFSCDNTSCVFLDLAGETFSNDIVDNVSNISNLKTAVVDGAFSFCADFAAGKGDYILKNKNVYAQYGLMFKIGNTWVWEKLIDTHTTPVNINEALLSDDGMTIYEYDSDKFDASVSSFGSFNSNNKYRRDFSTVSIVYVIQSYSINTLDDWKKQNHDMISVIGYADLENISGVREYSITIDAENQVNLHIGSNQMPLYAHDEYNSNSFRMSMWPIVR